jgi:uncharacterized protein involved in tolerance to divalent cations
MHQAQQQDSSSSSTSPLQAARSISNGTAQQSDQLAASLVQALIARACSSEAIASALWWQLKLQSQSEVDTTGTVTALYVQVMQQLEVSSSTAII